MAQEFLRYDSTLDDGATCVTYFDLRQVIYVDALDEPACDLPHRKLPAKKTVTIKFTDGSDIVLNGESTAAQKVLHLFDSKSENITPEK